MAVLPSSPLCEVSLLLVEHCISRTLIFLFYPMLFTFDILFIASCDSLDDGYVLAFVVVGAFAFSRRTPMFRSIVLLSIRL